MCRRFMNLQMRLILEKQDEMRLIEAELADRDEVDGAHCSRHSAYGTIPRKLMSRHRKDLNEDRDRRELFKRAETVFKEYAALLAAVNKLMVLDKPTWYEWKNVERFISTAKPTVHRESKWVASRDDLVSLRGTRAHGRLDATLESIILRCSSYFKPFKGLSSWIAANVRARKAAGISVSAFLSIFVPVLLIAPIYALSVVGQNLGQSIGVVVVFVVAFASVIAAGTPAKTNEVWNASAA